jgi:hypothetical protein
MSLEFSNCCDVCIALIEYRRAWVLYICVGDASEDAGTEDVELDECSDEDEPLVFDTALHFLPTSFLSLFVCNDLHVSVVFFRLRR